MKDISTNHNHPNLIDSIYALLSQKGKQHTIDHSMQVARQALLLADRYQLGTDKCELAAALHDISAIIPPNERVEAAENYHLPILDEERLCSILLHQKLSKTIAINIFHITDKDVLSAIECHSTLKAQASDLDVLIFVADKIAWDGQGDPPWKHEMETALKQSLRHGALAYIQYLLSSKEILVPHPWLIEARNDLHKHLD